MNARAWRNAVGGALLACVAVSAAARAQMQTVARVSVSPSSVRLGEAATYRGYVVVEPGTPVRWLPAQNTDVLTWGPRRAVRSKGFGGSENHPHVADTVRVEVAVQAFQLGRVELPGIGVLIGPGTEAVTHHLPAASLDVLPMISPADSQSTLRPVRGPLAAPWWERVPWQWVILGLALLVAAILLVRRLRKRRGPQAAPAAPDRSPAEVALESLAALRALHLPEAGRMAEHAFRLGQILRRYLEATTPVTRPGHTTPELVRSLGQSGLSAEDLKRLSSLLRAWDMVKFARAPLGVDEAARSEQAVEAFVRRGSAAASPTPERGAA